MVEKIKALLNKIPKKNDLFFTVGATVALQFTLQIILYPLITRLYGKEFNGDILYYISIVYIIPQAVGNGISNVRLTSRKNLEEIKGEFIPLVTGMGILAGSICAFAASFSSKDPAFLILYGVYACIYAYRYYMQVQYRLTLDFKIYFLNYLILSVGYLIGFGIFHFTHGPWLIIYITGESLALIHSLIYTKIKSFKISSKVLFYVFRHSLIVIASALVHYCVNQFDKIILKHMVSSEMVTNYNALALVGKSIQMLVGPVNTLMLSYFSIKGKVITKALFRKITKFTLILGVGAILLCQIGTPLYVYLFYQIDFRDVFVLGLMINLGMIFGFIASLYNITVLSQGKTKIYSVIEVTWGILSFLLAWFLTMHFDAYGMAIATLTANSLKLAATYIMAYRMSSQAEKEQSER